MIQQGKALMAQQKKEADPFLKQAPLTVALGPKIQTRLPVSPCLGALCLLPLPFPCSF